MLPLSLDDLVPLEEFAGKRRDYFESHRRYLDRYRRVRIGPLATLLFENRQTLWFRVQEVLRIARLADPKVVQQELDLFNRLLPGPGELQAALLIEVQEEVELPAALAAWAELDDEHIQLHLGKNTVPGQVLTCRPEDRCIGAAQWVQFRLDALGHHLLADFRQPALIEIALPGYAYQSPLLSNEIRESLVDDVKSMDKAWRAAA